jgi:predicted dithiol-disulfide oxidoreductase (DUF899 family)
MAMKSKPVVTREEWTRTRLALLAKEKELTRARDALAAERRKMPMVKIDKPYVFEEVSGKRTLLDLFGDKDQLIVQHFMFAPEWDVGCKSCSFMADSLDRSLVHLEHRNTAFVAISRAPVSKLETFKKRMGWHFRWLSSGDTDFNYDFGVSFRPEDVAKKSIRYNYKQVDWESTDLPGLSTFLREGNDVLHTYSTYERAMDDVMIVYRYLDLTPLGRQEDEHASNKMKWLRLHDDYGKRST